MTSTPSSQPDQDPIRSTGSVLLLAACVLIPLLIAITIFFLPSRSSGSSADSIIDSLSKNSIHAVYLSDDSIYFGLVGEPRGNFFVLKDAFFLRANDSSAVDGKAESEPRLTPVPASAEVGGDGNVLINANEVLRVQTLAKDSPIAKAIKTTKD